MHLSSAVVQARQDNWYYYDTIGKGIDALWKRRPNAKGPASCTAALSTVSEFVDSVLLEAGGGRNETKVAALKQFFGASFPIADDDFA